MKSDGHANPINRVHPEKATTMSHPKGNILVYLVVVLLIFGVLGVSLVSLFTTATGSSATPNDAKRARFIAESGIRYALSEIRNSADVTVAAELLNTTSEFKLGKNGGFTASVFSPGLRSDQNKSIGAGGSSLRLNAPYSGKFPDDFDVHNAVNDVYIVDWLRFKGTSPPDDSYALVTASPDPGGAIDVTLDVGDNYDADLEDTVCFALLTTDAQTNIPQGSSIYVNEKASEFFPNSNGAIRILTLTDGSQYDYFYETREPPSGGKVELTNVRAMPGDAWTNIADLRVGDYVILSAFNFRLFATGKSDEISTSVGYNRPFWAMARPDEFTIYMRELLQEKSIKQAGNVIRTQEAGDKKIELGRGASGTEGFGDLWYGGNKTVAGNSNFCNEGRCIFDLGVRVFFTADFNPGANDGQGLTFALIAGGTLFSPVNTKISAGGDFQLPELLAYAGNSQLDNSPTYLDTTGTGLIPPKMAVEFDTNTDFDAAFNSSLAYCSGSDLVADSRNDPKPENQLRDVVQYVFWGNNEPADFNLACRITPESYDDNRHDAEGDQASLNFSYPTGAPVRSDPIFDATDGTIYFGSDDSATDNFWAVKSDGALKWSFDVGATAIQSKPALDTFNGDRYVYFTARDGFLYRMDATTGLQQGVAQNVGSVGTDTDVSPAVDEANQIYIGTNSDVFRAYENIDAINWSLAWSRDTGEDIQSSPVVDKTGGAYNGIIYVGRDADGDPTGGKVFSFDAAGNWNPNWGGLQTDAFSTTEDVDSRPALSKDGSRIYAVDDQGSVYAIDAGTGGQVWRENLSRSVNFLHPTIDTSGGSADGTIYVPTDTGRLFALNSDGSRKSDPPWPINFGVNINSSPIVGSDGTIYIGTNDGLVHAINPDATFKWQFPTGAAVQSSPEIGDDKTVYVGSDDNNLYAIATVALPRNFRNSYVNFQRGHLTSENLDTTVSVADPDNWLDGELTKGPWAVRTEIVRATSVNANGNYEYTLRSWLRQCAQSDCSDIKSTPFQDTTRKYDFLPGPPFPDLPFEQVIELTPAEHDDFERFLFGFTTAASATDTQLVEIRDFQLTFIQSGDPTIIADPAWLP